MRHALAHRMAERFGVLLVPASMREDLLKLGLMLGDDPGVLIEDDEAHRPGECKQT